MSRIARVVGVGLPHHVTQRGNYKQKVFFNAENCRKYIAWVKEYSIKYGLSTLAYCLMPNHVHFIAVPERIDSLAKTFNAAHMRYSQYFNRKLEQNGHLWQGRFYSCVLDQGHLMLAARYVERNPVRAGLAKKPWMWQWSSAAAHISGGENELVKADDLLEVVDMSAVSWKGYIESDEDDDSLQDIIKNTHTGRPSGGAEFIMKLEKDTGRRLSALSIGRPKKGDSDRFSVTYI